jgi:magnesium-transporting ATPase (P-type)
MWRNILVQATYQLILLVVLLNKGPQWFKCEDGSTHHFTILFNAFVFCQVFNEFNAREIGDIFDPFRALKKSPMFLFVIAFTVLAQYLIVEYGGDFTQTFPLTFEEWRITAFLGAMSIPVGFIMRQIPVSEDPDTFAGIGDKVPKSTPSFLGTLFAFLLPVLLAIVYQLYQEVEELKH